MKRILIIEWMVVAVIIVCGEFVFGFKTDRWVDAAQYAGVLLAIYSLDSQLMYWRAKQRIQDWTSRRTAPFEMSCELAGDLAAPPHPSRIQNPGKDHASAGNALPTENGGVLAGCPAIR